MISGRSTSPADCTVLVADDDADVLVLCAELVAGAGYRVETARDGSAALEALRSGRFDATILDIDMPGMTGVDVARALRAGPATRDCAIVFHTATARREVDALFAGYDAFVRKPCLGQELANSLAEAIVARLGGVAQ